MIAVIADDFSGAAEMAGIAFARGLTAEVQTVFDPATNADVVVVDTATRSKAATEAREITGRVAARIFARRPDWVFKKVDSLLRGNVVVEIDAVRRAGGSAHVLLVPANPSRGRTIRDGRYMIDGVPLAESSLAVDAEYPRRSSHVRDLLGGTMPVPDATTEADVRRHAGAVGPGVLPAGAADFFEALLEVRGTRGDVRPQVRRDAMAGPVLFVCGSLAAWRAGRGEEFRRCGLPVFRLPDELLGAQIPAGGVPAFAREVGARLREEVDPGAKLGSSSDDPPKPRATLLAIGRSETVATVDPAALLDRLAAVVHLVMDAGSVGRLCVEGGATAGAIACRLGWSRLCVVGQPAAGVVTLVSVGADTPPLTVKVGSYAWPEDVASDSSSPGATG